VILEREQLRYHLRSRLHAPDTQVSLKKMGHNVPVVHPMEVLDASVGSEPVENLLRR